MLRPLCTVLRCNGYEGCLSLAEWVVLLRRGAGPLHRLEVGRPRQGAVHTAKPLVQTLGPRSWFVSCVMTTQKHHTTQQAQLPCCRLSEQVPCSAVGGKGPKTALPVSSEVTGAVQRLLAKY